METNFAKFLRKTTEYLIYLLVFLLPWQTKLIFRSSETNYSEISLYLSNVLLLLILLFFLILKIKEKNRSGENRPIIYSLCALALFMFFSIYFAPDKVLAFYRYFIFLNGVSLFFIIRAGTKQRNYQDTIINKTVLIYTLLTSILFQASLGIYQFLTQSSFAFKYLGIAEHNPATLGTAVIETANGRWLRAYGGLDHPNILGGVLALSLILAAYMLAKEKILTTRKQIRASAFLFIFYFISLYALFFTFSRAAWLALAAGYLTLLIIFIVKKDKWLLSRFIALLFFSAVLVTIAAAPYQDLLMVRLDAESRLEQKSITERKAYIVEARNILQKSFLSGVGIGNYGVVTSRANDYQKAVWDYQPVHNTFLLLWTECGLFSLLSFLIFIFFLIKNGRREIFAFAIIIPLLVLMLLDHWLISLPFGIFFLFLLLGLI